MTQLTNAPQGGLAEFNPFSEVGEHALFLSPWGLWGRTLAEMACSESCHPPRDSLNHELGGVGLTKVRKSTVLSLRSKVWALP